MAGALHHGAGVVGGERSRGVAPVELLRCRLLDGRRRRHGPPERPPARPHHGGAHRGQPVEQVPVRGGPTAPPAGHHGHEHWGAQGIGEAPDRDRPQRAGAPGQRRVLHRRPEGGALHEANLQRKAPAGLPRRLQAVLARPRGGVRASRLGGWPQRRAPSGPVGPLVRGWPLPGGHRAGRRHASRPGAAIHNQRPRIQHQRPPHIGVCRSADAGDARVQQGRPCGSLAGQRGLHGHGHPLRGGR
mmetsp:Transcript_34372/g.93084  ORF Transcript_34372/g.93084 Transcript_34372/m.93084 type:complete len:244 (-) Transcript_34372:720-1451(-)